jgi:hypothetical protein
MEGMMVTMMRGSDQPAFAGGWRELGSTHRNHERSLPNLLR